MTNETAVMDAEPKIATNANEAAEGFRSLVNPGVPSFFKLKARLPLQGRTDTPVAATDDMTVVLKTYAATGENELHAHTTEDHTFIVLQGRANFYGPKGEVKTIVVNEGVMLPRGTFYWCRAEGETPLVKVRVGSTRHDPKAPLARFDRINIDGSPMAADSKENKQVELILSDNWFGPKS